MKKQIFIPILLTLLMSMVGIKSFAHDIEVTNSDGKIIYYLWMNNNTELAVSFKGNTYKTYSNEYSGKIVIPESVSYNGTTYPVTSIGGDAFRDCSGLTSITIPNSVTTIGDWAIFNCNELSSINVNPDNTVYDSRNNCNALIETASNTLIAGCQNTEIPTSVTSIERDAFAYCRGLTSVTIPNSVTSIGNNAFADCSNLSSITIPSSVTSISWGVFYGCSGLTSVTIPNSVTSIGGNAFAYCSGLISVTIPNSVTSIGERAFSDCSGLISITIPNSVSSIGNRAFEGCSGLTSITIPNSVTSIGNSAFYDCEYLTSITIGNNVTSIGENAFGGCSRIISVVLNCEKIKNWFSNNTIIREIVIGQESTIIGNSAFDGCSGLTSVTISNNVKSIGEFAFRSCRNLTSITIPNSVTSIGNSAFYGCRSLTSIAIPNSVTSIGNSAFSGCSSLTSIAIPNSVTIIGENAFYGCSNVTSLKLPDNLRLIKKSSFQECGGLKSLVIPSTVEVIYQEAFADCNSLEDVTSQATNPPFLYDNSFSNYSIPLNVPSGCKGAYQEAQGWRNFTNISDGNMYNQLNITMENDMQTYCPLDDVDFSNVEGLKAFTATGYDHGTLTVSRVLNAPAGTGLLLQGTAGVTYQVPYATQTGYYINLLHGLTQDTQVSPTAGDQTNFLLGKKNGVTTFYRVAQTGTVSAGKAYLQLPTSVVGDLSGSRVMRIVADDETTGISEALPLNDNGEMTNDNVYDLQGRRVTKPTRGLYIVNGRKVVIK